MKTNQEENFIKQSMAYSEKAVYMHEARTACFKKECSENRDKQLLETKQITDRDVSGN